MDTNSWSKFEKDLTPSRETLEELGWNDPNGS